MKTTEIRFNDKEYSVKLADNFITRAKGLSFQKKGKMLFAFPEPQNAKIDMMFLSKKLYLYFINSEKEIIDSQEAIPWGWNPKTWKLYDPGENYKFLLESFERLDLDEGDKLSFEI